MKLTQISKFAFIAFCCIGCFCQLAVVTVDFLKFKTTTKVLLDTSDDVRIPGLTLCLDMRFLARFEDWTQQNLKLVNINLQDFNKSKWRKAMKDARFVEKLRLMLFHLTLPQLKQLMRIPLTHNLTPIYLLDESTGRTVQNPESYFNAFIFFADKYICWTSRPNAELQKKSLKRHDIIVTEMPGMPVGFELSHAMLANVPYVFLSVHCGYKLPRNPVQSMYGVALRKESEMYVLKYSKTRIQRMLPPFDTGCKDYRREGQESQIQAIQDCMNDIEFDLLNASTGDLLLASNLNRNVVYAKQLNSEEMKTFQEIVQICRNKFTQPDCYESRYVTRRVSHHSTNMSSSQFWLLESNEASSVIKYEAKTSFTDFVVSFGSVLAYWFGFTIFSCYSLINAMITKIQVQKRKRPMKINYHRNRVILL